MSEEVPPFAHSTPLLGMKPGGWGAAEWDAER